VKIGVVRQRYTAIGGAERYLGSVIHELVARGHDVHVFANSWEGEGFTFHRVPMMRGASFLKALTFALSARKVLRREKCDLVFSLERTLEQDVYRAGDGCHRQWLGERAKYESALKTARVRLNPLHWTLCGLEKRTFSPERTGRIIANSNRGKREIVEHYGFPEERIDVIHNGVDCERFRPSSEKRVDKGVRLLFVGTGFERKGLAFCIGALKHLPEDVRLRVVGKGNTARYAAMARNEGVDSRVEFAGGNQNIAAVYGEADLLVHPAIYEPFANVCLEALASGLPVITSRINGASEVIEHGKSGAIIDDPGDTVALAEAIRPFLDVKFRAVASGRARTVAEAHPFAQNIAETLRVLTQVRESNR
jgi:UDP-glucose:(heptosyl)LPS alpha-1,3-glucosyltransferase